MFVNSFGIYSFIVFNVFRFELQVLVNMLYVRINIESIWIDWNSYGFNTFQEVGYEILESVIQLVEISLEE